MGLQLHSSCHFVWKGFYLFTLGLAAQNQKAVFQNHPAVAIALLCHYEKDP